MRRLAVLSVSIFVCVSLSAQSFVERHSESYPVSAKTDLLIHNVVGDVDILPWDEPKVQVDWAFSSYTKRGLDRAWVEIDPHENTIEIRTAYPVSRDMAIRKREIRTGPDSVNYTIRVGRNVHAIEIRTDEGDVRVAGLSSDLRVFCRSGSVSIDNIGGNLEVSTLHAAQRIKLGKITGHRSIHLESVNGSIRLSLARTSDSTLQAISANGGLSNEFGWAPHRTQYHRDLQGKLGKGEAKVEVEEVNGSVMLISEPER
jgi:DUF4097 and DUF4098 domain-containing protein YvlB